jgi:hypothetical protein
MACRGTDVVLVATPPAPSLQRRRRDGDHHGGDRRAGFIVIGWLTRIVISLSVIGVFTFDALSVGSASLTVSDAANGTAIAARDVYNNNPNNRDSAYAAAERFADSHGVVLIPSNFTISNDGRVTVTVTKVAHTVVLEHIPPLTAWTVRSATATSGKVR